MNVGEINPGTYGRLHTFFAVAIPFTVFSVWAIGAVQFRPTSGKEDEKAGDGADTGLVYGRRPGKRTFFWRRVGWPVVLIRRFIEERVWKSRSTSITKSG